MKPKQIQEIEVKKVCCPKCSSVKVKKRGFRQTENRGKIQRYFCRDCKKSFVIDDGFFRMRNAPQKITLCLDLFFRGVSTRKVQEHLQAFYPANSSWVSIYTWVTKYSKMIGKFTDKLKVDVGQELQIDEVEYRVNKRKAFFIDSIDTETRFMVASKFVRHRSSKEIKSVLKSVKHKTDNQIKIITSDGFNAYISAVKVMGVDKRFKTNPKVIHNVVTQLKGEGFNHKVERLHSNVRERTKVFRGFGSINGAYAIMKGYEIFHNFIKKHQAINCCPYELACPELKLGVNKWLDLIQMSEK